MTHKEEVKLNRLQFKLEVELKIIQTLLNECGDWHDGTGKDKLVLRVFEDERLEASIFESNKYRTYIATVPGWKMKMEIRDEEVVELIDARLNEIKAKKAKEEAKKAAAIQAKSNVSYLDVVKRVAKYVKEHGGYVVKFTEDENAKITMTIGGGHTMIWDNAKDFVSATFDSNHYADFDDRKCVSIFAALFHWECKYYKLAYPSLKKLVKDLMLLTKIGAKPMFPFQIMKELDKLKI